MEVGLGCPTLLLSPQLLCVYCLSVLVVLGTHMAKPSAVRMTHYWSEEWRRLGKKRPFRHERQKGV